MHAESVDYVREAELFQPRFIVACLTCSHCLWGSGVGFDEAVISEELNN